MKKTKVEKGITLIALIITIIILLILAVVTIGSIKNSNIITYAQNASTNYEKAKNDEEGILAGYESTIKENLPGENESSEIGKATVGTKTTKNSTIDGKEYSSTNPIIPAGYAPINITGENESKWDEKEGPQVSEGLVITDNTTTRDDNGNTIGNEFVWIPVSDISAFAVPQEEGSKNYKGVLSDNDFWPGKEPANLTGPKSWDMATTVNGKPVGAATTYAYDGEEMFKLFDMGTYSENYYQDKFNKMVESVAKYGGFYVGRYETSLNEDKTRAQSKAGQPVMNEMEWYRMYTYSEKYSQSGVVSEMIWGCQWDAMMRFIGEEYAKANGRVSHELSSPYETGGTNYTETKKYEDISNNIYDLEGNVSEWTQEADCSVDSRTMRGGYFGFAWGTPDTRDDVNDPAYHYSKVGSRLALYIV